MNGITEELPLRDIHLPDPVSWWPLAPGWWILLLLLITVISLLVYLVKRRDAKQRSPFSLAVKALSEIEKKHSNNENPQVLIRDVSRFFRQLAVNIKPRSEVAAMTGNEWLTFLDGDMDKKPFTKGPGKVLIDAPYQKQAFVDKDELLNLCHQWIDFTLDDSPRKKDKVKI